MAAEAGLARPRRRATLFGVLGLGVLVLCWLTFVQGLLPLRGSGWGDASTRQHAPASSSAADKLLVIVIAAGDKPVYSVQRGFWRLMRERVRAAGVHVYLVGMDANITRPFAADDGALLFPGVNSLIPGVLEATVRALEHVQLRQLPGSAAPFVLRSNVSTFWNFWRLLAWLADKPTQGYVAAAIGNRKNVTFPGGNGFVMSADVARLLVTQQDSLAWKEEFDDFVVGKLLQENGIGVAETLPRIEVKTDLKGQLPSNHDDGRTFEWRIKSPNGPQDAAYWASLFFFWYGPRTDLAAV